MCWRSTTFGTLFIELFFITSSIWMSRVYCMFGFLFILLILLIVVCIEISWVLTYMRLCWGLEVVVEFFSSGPVAIYIFVRSANYLAFELKSSSGPWLLITDGYCTHALNPHNWIHFVIMVCSLPLLICRTWLIHSSMKSCFYMVNNPVTFISALANIQWMHSTQSSHL